MAFLSEFSIEKNKIKLLDTFPFRSVLKVIMAKSFSLHRVALFRVYVTVPISSNNPIADFCCAQHITFNYYDYPPISVKTLARRHDIRLHCLFNHTLLTQIVTT